MKKLLLLLFIVPLLAACSKNNEEVDTNEYIDKSVILGTWADVGGYYIRTYKFTMQKVYLSSYDTFMEEIVDNYIMDRYKITKDRVFFDNDKTKGRPYYIVEDTLYFASSSDPIDPFGKYIRVKEL